MLRSVLAACVMMAGAAHSATVQPGPTEDGFRALCQGCETAVAEIRGGGRGEWELDARAASGPNSTNRDYSIARGVAHAFHIAYDAADGTLAVGAGLGQQPLTYDRITFDAAQAARFGQTRSLFVRARARDWRDSAEHGGTRLSDLMLNGERLGGLTAVDGASYLTVSGFDFTRSFDVTGSFLFDYTKDRPRSHYATQLKFADLDVAPVPVPAAGLLLIAGLGALAATRRRAPARAVID